MTMKSSASHRLACLEITLCEDKTSEINLLSILKPKTALQTTSIPARSWPRNSGRTRAGTEGVGVPLLDKAGTIKPVFF